MPLALGSVLLTIHRFVIDKKGVGKPYVGQCFGFNANVKLLQCL